VAGGVGANRRLRERLRRDIGARGGSVHFPDAMFCTDNGAMIALAGALRIADARAAGGAFDVMPRWELPDTSVMPDAGATAGAGAMLGAAAGRVLNAR
jgi:N6-L-threonylcarbamoyladenine synthase